MKDYKYIFFDLDGTLVDSGYSIMRCAQLSLERHGIIENDMDKLRKFVGPPLLASYMNNYGMDEPEARVAIKDYREFYLGGVMYEVEVYDGVEKMLQKLVEAGKKLVVATSKPEKTSVDILTKLDLAKYFEFIAGDTPEGSRSAKADIISYAMTHEGITDKSQILMIGDTQYDVIGAKQMEVDVMAVTYGYGDPKLLEDAAPDYTVDTAENVAISILGKY